MRGSWDNSKSQIPSPFLLRLARQNVPLLTFLGLAFAGMFITYTYFSPSAPRLETQSLTELELVKRSGDAPVAPIHKPVNTLIDSQMFEPSIPESELVAIIAGHRGSDSGTECSDGLTEVQITESIAESVAAVVRSEGFEVETFDEFDTRLDGLSGLALVSIHIDSCDFINELASGYKISGSNRTDSSELSICLQHEYGEATQLPYHPNSITPHMANYHAFRKIDPITPATIIEIGFLNLDRELLTVDSEKVIKGLSDGILCFLEGKR